MDNTDGLQYQKVGIYKVSFLLFFRNYNRILGNYCVENYLILYFAADMPT